MTWAIRMAGDDVVMATTRNDKLAYACFPLRTTFMYVGGTYRWYNVNKAHVMDFPHLYFSSRRVER